MGIFRLRGWGGSPVPTSTNHYTTQKVNIFEKTKNVPNVLKCKINHNFFHKHGVPKQGGGGGGGPRLGKNSHIFPFFFWETSFIQFLLSPPGTDHCIFATKAVLLSPDFTPRRTRGGMHNYLTISPKKQNNFREF